MIASKITNWERLSNLKDEEIDYSDIPATDSEFWENGTILSPKNLVNLTVQIDEDLAVWLKKAGDNSSKILNNILRTYYLLNINKI